MPIPTALTHGRTRGWGAGGHRWWWGGGAVLWIFVWQRGKHRLNLIHRRRLSVSGLRPGGRAAVPHPTSRGGCVTARSHTGLLRNRSHFLYVTDSSYFLDWGPLLRSNTRKKIYNVIITLSFLNNEITVPFISKVQIGQGILTFCSLKVQNLTNMEGKNTLDPVQTILRKPLSEKSLSVK